MDVRDTIRDVGVRMDRLEAERESVIALSRRLIRGTKRAIHAIHIIEPYDLTELRRMSDELMTKVYGSPELLSSGGAQDAAAEFAEVCSSISGSLALSLNVLVILL